MEHGSQGQNLFLVNRPLVIRSWAADAFFWFPARPGTSSFFCCLREKSLIMMSAPQIRDLQSWENLTGVSFLYLQRNQSRFYLAQYRTDGKYLLIERTKQHSRLLEKCQKQFHVNVNFFMLPEIQLIQLIFLKLKIILNTIRFKFSY